MKRNEQHRTVHWPATRARQVALASAYLGMSSSEEFIQCAISQALRTLANNDRNFGLVLNGAL